MEAANIDKPIWAELKFNWSHGLSTPRLVHIHGDGGPQGAHKYYSPSPTDYKVTWMIRNEDIVVLRWGQADFIREHTVKMAILTVPATNAQEVVNTLVNAGITGILNFAPIVLQVPEEVMVNNVNLAIELENLSYFIQE